MKTVMVAHRGAQLIAPENTLRAFQLAIKNGFKAVQCDVQLTKDGHLVVIREDAVDRTTNGTGRVSKMTRSELRRLEVAGGDLIPSLHQVIYEVVIISRRKLIIEMGAGSELDSKHLATRLVEFIKHLHKRYWRYIEVHSGEYGALTYIKSKCPEIITAAMIYDAKSASEVINIARSTQANGVSLGAGVLTPKILRDCHTCKLFVDTRANSDKTVSHRLRPFGLNALIESFTRRNL